MPGSDLSLYEQAGYYGAGGESPSVANKKQQDFQMLMQAIAGAGQTAEDIAKARAVKTQKANEYTMEYALKNADRMKPEDIQKIVDAVSTGKTAKITDVKLGPKQPPYGFNETTNQIEVYDGKSGKMVKAPPGSWPATLDFSKVPKYKTSPNYTFADVLKIYPDLKDNTSFKPEDVLDKEQYDKLTSKGEKLTAEKAKKEQSNEKKEPTPQEIIKYSTEGEESFIKTLEDHNTKAGFSGLPPYDIQTEVQRRRDERAKAFKTGAYEKKPAPAEGSQTSKNFMSEDEAKKSGLPSGTEVTINGRRARIK